SQFKMTLTTGSNSSLVDKKDKLSSYEEAAGGESPSDFTTLNPRRISHIAPEG
ncbi:Hypothetical protein FKW44_025234, partial [Caligus rogercresseyi]